MKDVLNKLSLRYLHKNYYYIREKYIIFGFDLLFIILGYVILKEFINDISVEFLSLITNCIISTFK